MAFEIIYTLQNSINESKILGPNNINLNIMEELLGFDIIINANNIQIDNKFIMNKDKLIKLFTNLEKLLDNNYNITDRDIICLIKNIEENKDDEFIELLLKKDIIITMPNGKIIYPKSINQKRYLDQLRKNDIVFATGPAGTGKTFLAVLFAVSEMKKNNIKKIILVRPVVEAGERLGFLPGDLKEKIDPYLVPLYDTLYDSLGKETVERMIEKGSIEVAPLAYMRGRTLDNAIIILDEAQNSTKQQMKMFLTRLGFKSKMIITGDVTQIDLPNSNNSGLIEAINILNNIKGISIVDFKKQDVMRHPLVYKIVEKYEGKNEN